LANVDFVVKLTHQLEQDLANSALTITITDLATNEKTQVQLIKDTIALLSATDPLDVLGSFTVVTAVDPINGKPAIDSIVFDKNMAFGNYSIEVFADGFRTYAKVIQVNIDKVKKDSNGFVVMLGDGVYESIYNDAFFGIDNNKSSFVAGEIIKDGVVDLYDLSAVATNYDADTEYDEVANPGSVQFDLNRDGKVDGSDLAIVIRNWEK
jgi:hypothetical protein